MNIIYSVNVNNDKNKEMLSLVQHHKLMVVTRLKYVERINLSDLKMLPDADGLIELQNMCVCNVDGMATTIVTWVKSQKHAI